MKHMLIFLSVTAGLLFSSCKKDKNPDLNGTPNAISGQWRMDVSAVNMFAGSIIPEFTFGTNNRYMSMSGMAANPEIEKGTYTIVSDAGDLILRLKPYNGAEHTMEIKNRSGNSAVFHTSSHTMLYHRQ